MYKQDILKIVYTIGLVSFIALPTVVYSLEKLTPKQLNDKISDHYRSSENYHDRGTCKIERAIVNFETYYSKKYGFKLEWTHTSTIKGWKIHYVMWGSPECLKLYSNIKGEVKIRDCGRPEEFQQVDPITHIRTPSLLVPRYFLDINRETVGNSAAEITLLPSGENGYLLIEEFENNEIAKTFINPQTFHIIRHERGRKGSDANLTVSYMQVDFNTEISSADISFQPPSQLIVLSKEYPIQIAILFISFLIECVFITTLVDGLWTMYNKIFRQSAFWTKHNKIIRQLAFYSGLMLNAVLLFFCIYILTIRM